MADLLIVYRGHAGRPPAAGWPSATDERALAHIQSAQLRLAAAVRLFEHLEPPTKALQLDLDAALADIRAALEATTNGTTC